MKSHCNKKIIKEEQSHAAVKSCCPKDSWLKYIYIYTYCIHDAYIYMYKLQVRENPFLAEKKIAGHAAKKPARHARSLRENP